jgi:hypothetical protein
MHIWSLFVWVRQECPPVWTTELAWRHYWYHALHIPLISPDVMHIYWQRLQSNSGPPLFNSVPCLYWQDRMVKKYAIISENIILYCLLVYLLLISPGAIFQLSCGSLYICLKDLLCRENFLYVNWHIIRIVMLGFRFLGFPDDPSKPTLFFENQGNGL